MTQSRDHKGVESLFFIFGIENKPHEKFLRTHMVIDHMTEILLSV